MLKTLFKKQLMQANVWLIQNKRTGKNRNLREMLGLLVLYVLIFGMLCNLFFMGAEYLVGTLHGLGLDWLYFSMMLLIAIALGVFGSVFNTSATLYKAKDNELLLSMPIPPSKILIVRLFGVWMWSFIYELIVFVPTMLAYFKVAPFNLITLIFDIVVLIFTSIFVLTLSCILGWFVAKISSKLKNKNIITVILSIGFLAAYYYVYFKANELLQGFLLNALQIGESVKGSVYPLYIMGMAANGDLLSLIIFCLAIAIVFGIVYFVLSKSFIKMATMSDKVAKKTYKEKSMKSKSVGTTLFLKELKRFTSSSIYMLNCGLGIIMIVIVGGLFLIKADTINQMIIEFGPMKELIPLVLCAGLCMVSSMNDISAPSISLEGKNIWIYQSLPISAWSVLKAKLALHFVLTEIPLILCVICVISVVRLQIIDIIFMFLLPTLFVLFVDAFGLVINLKFPNLKWTDEIAPVKQSMGVLITLFSGFGVLAILGGLYFWIYELVTPILFMTLCTIILFVVIALLLLWLYKKGTKIFSNL